MTDMPDGPPDYGVERTPPASLEAEQAVVGALLQENDALERVSDLLEPASFFFFHNREIFKAVQALLRDGMPADLVTVAAWLADAGVGEEVDRAYLLAVQASVIDATHVRRYAEIVAKKADERALIEGCDAALRISWDGKLELADRMDRVAGVMARTEQARQRICARVPVLNVEELVAAAKAATWCVKHVVPANAVGMLFGASGTFKSFIALDMALHVAHGLPWMGRLTKRAPVLYIAAEGQTGLGMRVVAWHRARNIPHAGVPLHVVPVAIDLTQDAWRVVEAAQALGISPGLVVIDTVSQTYSGEENSANEMAAYLREIGLRFRALWQASVLLVHHTGHSATERPRGSSAILANLDYLLGAFRDEQELLATLTCCKQKDGELFADADFQLTPMELWKDDDGDAVTSLVARHLSTAEERDRARQAEQAAGRGGRAISFMAMVQHGEEERGLRKAFYESLDGLDAEAKKKAYYRARKRAIDSRQIEISGGIVFDLRKGAKQ